MTEKIILPEPFRTDWLKALRSGKYRQGVGALHSYVSNTFCCLGVAADITTDVEWGRISPSLRVELVKKEDNKSLGWDIYYGPSTCLSGLARALAKMNDEGASFTEIADWIEANTEGKG
jgi:hypothetical protein